MKKLIMGIATVNFNQPAAKARTTTASYGNSFTLKATITDGNGNRANAEKWHSN